jgi:hypothetical protein
VLLTAGDGYMLDAAVPVQTPATVDDQL